MLETLARAPLSVVLSFLSDSDGTSFLCTNKQFAFQILPIFKKRGSRVKVVEDATVLLERLNTRRLFHRHRNTPAGYSTKDLAQREWTELKQNGMISGSSFSYPPDLELLRFPSRIHDPELPVKAKTFLVSYPRSGNTLARHLIERATGVVTGSDTLPSRKLSQQLTDRHGLVGEGLVRGVSIVKSHWPERRGHCPVNGSGKVILLVRNPYDAIDSYWNLNATLTHTERLTDAVYERFADKFDGLVRSEIGIWHAFLWYWLVNVKASVCIVRYEDLIRDPCTELRRMLQCAFGVEALSDFWENRIRHTVSSMSIHRPNGIGKSLHRFSSDQLDYIHKVALDDPNRFMRRFDYSIAEQGFPSNFHAGTDKAADMSTLQSNGVSSRLNVGDSIRPDSNQYGRAMQQWRHSVTNDDKQPLPTVSRDRD